MNAMSHQVYLSGGGDADASFSLDKLFFTDIPLQGKLLYIPVALRGHRLFADASKWMRHVLTQHGRDDIHLTSLQELTNITHESVLDHDGMYIGGGNTWTLMEEVHTSGFDATIKEFAFRRGPLYGGSAGAILLGSLIDTHDDVNSNLWPDIHGIDICAPWSFACHYKEEMMDRFIEWARTHSSPIACIPEDAGLVFNTHVLMNVGPGMASLIMPDGVVTKIAKDKQFVP
jgi:dipeptidase E